MYKFFYIKLFRISLFIIILSLSMPNKVSANLYIEQPEQQSLLTSRFISKTDPFIASVNNISLKTSWWSRPHEYLWASQFVGDSFVVLDAGCGISHPFKWFLQETCAETWACDTDIRLMNFEKIITETKDDLGEEACSVVLANQAKWCTVHFINNSIFNLPVKLPKFDRIFCISTLEHLPSKDRAKTLKEFSRCLAPKGLIILTVDFPAITPEEIIHEASLANLVPAGYFIGNNPPPNSLTNGHIWIFRCVLKHAN